VRREKQVQVKVEVEENMRRGTSDLKMGKDEAEFKAEENMRREGWD
jgi:hypothetical protein